MTGIAPEVLAGHMRNKTPMVILDMRDAKRFMEGHIEGAANARCSSMQQKQIIMSKMPRNVMVVLVDEDGSESSQNAAMMARFGFNAHHMEGGMKKWTGQTAQSSQGPAISGEELYQSLGEVFLLDVREPQEYAEFRIPGAVNVPLSKLFESTEDIPRDKRIITVCSHGNRSMVATFALAKGGLESTSLEGGMSLWNQVLAPTDINAGDIRITQVEKVGKGCLSYVISSDGEAAVIDAVHPADKIASIAQERGLCIRTVIDTHQHADHISAGSELARMTGAEFCVSGSESYDVDAKKIGDGDTIVIGRSRMRAIHTPGHTPGSMSYEVGGCLFCGDTVFPDGIGRPDLRDRAEEYAGMLHGTLQKVAAMPPDTRIFPAHRGEGTKPGPDGTYSTTASRLAEEPAVRLSRDEFVSRIAETAVPRPMNHSVIIRVNKNGMPVPPEQIPDLEMGPNRCGIKA